MTIYYAIAAIALTLAAVAMILRKYQTTKKAAARYQLPLRLLSTLVPNCFQCIRLYEPGDLSDNIKHISTTLSLSKDFDPFHLFYTDQQAYFFVNILFTKTFPCFYIFSKRFNLDHIGKKFSQPFLLNRTRYGMLGNISDAVHEFVEKHDIIHFYSSYLPKEIFDDDSFNVESQSSRNNKSASGKSAFTSMKSSLELKIKLEGFSDEMIKDFLRLFKGLEEEKEKKYERIIKEYRIWRNEQDTLEKRGFFEKLTEYAKSKQQSKKNK